MDAATFATGISVQPPAERSRREPFFPFARPPPLCELSIHALPASAAPVSPELEQQTPSVVETEDAADNENEQETCAALQEVAYQYACERSRAAVDAVIAGANVNCYRQVLGFFERYRSQALPPPADDNHCPSAALVSFPEFHAFPAAGVVSGADATSSDVWIAPLCQVLQRSFPLVLVLPPDVATARRLVEWIAEQLDTVKIERAREEQWLVQEIDAFALFDAGKAQPDATSLTAPNERITRRKRRELEDQWQRRQPERRARQAAQQSKGRGDAGYSSGSAFEDDLSDGSDDYSSDDAGSGGKRPAKRIRVGAASRSSRSRPTAGQVSRPYAKWTVDQLLGRVWNEVNALMTGSDPCEAWMAALRDMVLAPLNELIEVDVALERAPVTSCESDEASVESVPPSTGSSVSIRKAVMGCQTAIQWLMGRIVDSRCVVAAGPSASPTGSSPMSVPQPSAPTASASAAVKMRSTEFALAQLLHEVLQLSLDFAASTIGKIKVITTPASPADLPALLNPTGGAALPSLLLELESWRSTLTGWVKKHEAQYQLHHYHSPSHDPPKSYLLLCIEELEAFAPQVLDDFLEIWTHFRQIQQSFQQGTVTASSVSFRPPPSLMGFMSMGLIVGVASGASPALRRLPVAVVSRLDMQFFQLDDSLKCFDDILESLVVDQKLPLALSGAALRLLAERHRTTQSIAVFLHALRYLLFSHFKHVPWSMLSHFAFAKHCVRPLDALRAIASLSPAAASWLIRKRRRQELPTGRACSSSDLVASYLDLFPARGARVAELVGIVARSTRGNGKTKASAGADWKRSTARELQRLARRRARWTVGWQCFRSACSWLDVSLAGDVMLTHLALALDGKLATGEMLHLLVQQLERASPTRLQPMVDHWRALVQGLLSGDDAGAIDGTDPSEERVRQLVETLRELVMLSAYCVETQEDAETKRMLAHVRREVRDVFIDHLVVEFVQSSASPSVSKSSKWSLDDLMTLRLDQSVASNLHFSYHDKLKDLLMTTALEEEEEGEGKETRTPTWLEDVSIAFLYYQENPGVQLSLRDWFDAFADAVGGEVRAERTKEEKRAAQTEVKARFLRAFCTLRHWGFVRSEATSDRDAVEKLVFI